MIILGLERKYGREREEIKLISIKATENNIILSFILLIKKSLKKLT